MAKRSNFRDEQLAHLIAEELEIVLLASSDRRLGDLSVVAVEPLRSPGSFCAYLAPSEGDTPHGWEELWEALNGAATYLRSEVIRGLNLRKAPQLTLRLVPE